MYVDVLLLHIVLLRFCIAELIDPKRLLITTILDGGNHEVIRDGLTLLRSIRLMGGQMNFATIMVTVIPVDNWLDQDETLTELYSLNVEVVFSQPTLSNLPKTLYKYKAFETFDSLRFDYLLWLDADIVIFNDPSPYLLKHKHPGEICCVPDLYRYLHLYRQQT